jgi:hypothetical protein
MSSSNKPPPGGFFHGGPMRISLVALAALAVLLPAFLLCRAGSSLPLGGAALADGPPGPAHSHPNGGDWIMQGRHRNAAGEWCCGEDDCFVVTAVATVTRPAPGYLLPGSIGEDRRERPDGEFVPQHEAQSSPDGQFWRCRRPDGSRRCFFAPPPNS